MKALIDFLNVKGMDIYHLHWNLQFVYTFIHY